MCQQYLVAVINGDAGTSEVHLSFDAVRFGNELSRCLKSLLFVL
jgi:hypothetical protein